MKSNLPPNCRPGRRRPPLVWCLAAALLATAFCAGCGSKPPAGAVNPAVSANAKPAAAAAAIAHGEKGTNSPALVKSTFHADPKFGRDPFFPGAKAESAKGQDPATLAPQLPLMSYLKLVGIRSGTARPMALINLSPIAQGEESEVSIVLTNSASKLEVQKINVRCLEVRRDSVLISIAGEQGTRELRMAQAK